MFLFAVFFIGCIIIPLFEPDKSSIVVNEKFSLSKNTKELRFYHLKIQ